MAREGKKLELYEILAAKRAKGKIPPGLDAKNIRPANTPDDDYQPPPPLKPEESRRPGVIIDDSLGPEAAGPGQASVSEADAAPPRREGPFRRSPAAPAMARDVPEPVPVREARPRSAREVVFALDTALLFFSVVIALVASSYFLGYKRGQEEKPADLAGGVDTASPAQISVRSLGDVSHRSPVGPPEQDYTLLLRTEPASEGELPERLELELGEAVARGRQFLGEEIQGFIFRSDGATPQYFLSVGLARTANDQGLNRLFQVYNNMDGLTFSRVPLPYKGCRVAQVGELGTPVY